MANHNFLITEIVEIDFNMVPAFVGVRLESEEGDLVSLGLHPDTAHAIAVNLFEGRQKAANAGIFPEQQNSNAQYTVLATPHDKGVDIAMDLGPHKTQLNFQLSKNQARELGQRLLSLADAPDSPAGKGH